MIKKQLSYLFDMYTHSLHKVAILIIYTMCFISCNLLHFDEKCDNEEGSIISSSLYLTLTIHTNEENTRSNPTGGEDGDGREIGAANENHIEQLVLCFIEADDNVIDPNKFIDDRSSSAKAMPIIMEYCETPSFTLSTTSNSWTTQPIKINKLKPNVDYYMIVIANVYNLLLDGIKTVGDLQDYVFEGDHWSIGADVTQNSRFVMTSRFRNSSDIQKVRIEHKNDYYNPAHTQATLERLAARVDIIPITDGNGAVWNNAGYYEYVVKPTSGNTSADKVRLMDVQLINRYNQGSYLLKHIAAADNTTQEIDYNTITLVGSEETVSGKQINYVVDPLTNQKIGGIKQLWFDYYFSDSFVWNAITKSEKDKSLILDYTKENTFSKKYQEEQYITSLAMKCVYVPGKWYVVSTSGTDIELVSAPENTTFYSYNKEPYATIQALVIGINKDKGSGAVNEVTAERYEGVEKHINGVCYYTYFIKHANDNDDSVDGIMEYGIVRNNIYSITISSFKGVGDPSMGRNVECVIWVKPWRVIQNAEIIL